MQGGGGADEFIFTMDDETDTVLDFVQGEDLLNMSNYGYGDFNALVGDLTSLSVAANSVTFTVSGGETFVIEGATTFDAADFVF